MNEITSYSFSFNFWAENKSNLNLILYFSVYQNAIVPYCSIKRKENVLYIIFVFTFCNNSRFLDQARCCKMHMYGIC
jgi:hypothetical protein